LKSALADSPEFKETMESNETYEKILRYSQALEGLVRQTGIHAAGVVIGPGTLSDYVPLAISTQKDSDRSVLVQFEGKWLDDLRMLKMDFLGLKTLTLIKRAVNLVKQSQGVDIDIEQVDLTDKATFELLSQGKTDGVFQFESAGMKKYLRELKPNVFEDAIAMVALYRPGPMQFIDTFIKRKHGLEKIEYDHPLTQNALEETYGVTVYQEQVMRIAKEMGGFESAEAGALRKAISKKKADLMAKMYEHFKEGSLKNGVSQKVIDKIWSNWQDFANYAFNKSHAACYAFIAFQTAYLKAHYPVEFMAALLSLEENPDKIPAFLDECKNMKIEVIPPDINRSGKYFAVEGNRILFGLQAIKNVGSAAIDSIVEERNLNGKFTDLFDFCERVSSFQANRGTVESLIKAGAMDSLGERSQLFAAIDTALSYGSSKQRDNASGQLSLFGGSAAAEYERPKLPEKYVKWGAQEKLRYEKEILGFFISGHPILEYKVLIDHFCNFDSQSLQKVKENPPRDSQYSIIGFVSQINFKKTSRNNDTFAILQCEDMLGSFEVVFWPRNYEENKTEIQKAAENNGVYIFQGAPNTRGENQVSFMAEKLAPASQAQRIFNHTIKICLKENEIIDSFPQAFPALFQKFPGNFWVEFEIEDETVGRVLAPTRHKVNPTADFLAEIETICGRQACLMSTITRNSENSAPH